MKNKKGKLFDKKFLFILFAVVLSFYLYMQYFVKTVDSVSNKNNMSNTSITTLSNKTSKSEYPIIKKDDNSNYLGVGRKKVENQEGYFTTFTTIENNKKTYKEYKQNSTLWGNKEYWGGTMSENGCGITVMSIILSGYNKNYNPEILRKKYYPVLNYDNLPSELYYTYKIKNSGFYYDNLHLSSNSIIKYLDTNRPIIICVWNKPTANRWTTSSHYMSLLACDNNNMVYVSNPNRR